MARHRTQDEAEREATEPEASPHSPGSNISTDENAEERESPSAQMRYTCFYPFDAKTLQDHKSIYSALPNDARHRHIFAVSHKDPDHPADSTLAATVHGLAEQNESFKYAPAFDLKKLSVHHKVRWDCADDPTLRSWAKTFREAAVQANADYFTLNELFHDVGSATQSAKRKRQKVMALLKYLNLPVKTSTGSVRLRGVLFMTHCPSTSAGWTAPNMNTFWNRVNSYCDLVVAEHYHSLGYICKTRDLTLTNDFFTLRKRLYDKGGAMRHVATQMFTVLHSSYYGAYVPLRRTWGGATTSEADIERFERYLARCAHLTRNPGRDYGGGAGGGVNRIAFGPISCSLPEKVKDSEDVIRHLCEEEPTLSAQVRQRLVDLINWHYNNPNPARELECYDRKASNCACDAGSGTAKDTARVSDPSDADADQQCPETKEDKCP